MNKNADNTELAIWLKLHLAYVNAKSLERLREHVGDLTQISLAQSSDWLNVPKMSAKQTEVFFQVDDAQIQQALDWAKQPGQHILTLEDDAFPELLREIPDPPILLYVRGDLSLLKSPQLAVVGSRHASRQGLQIAEDFGQHLSQVGLCITSGLAHGIDAAAHRGGLRGQGQTLAVVGTGLDRIYPAANQNLARQIAEQGAIVSEYPLGTKPLAQNFPKRNRLISGMATGCLVVEAALKSGSLITARQAMEQGREVFAVPGSINNSLAKGCHQLIKQGAKLVESAQDVLEELAPLINFSWQHDKRLPEHSASGAVESPEHPLLAIMEYEPISLDELVVMTKMAASEIQAQMMMLELNGQVVSLSAGRWQRN